MTILEYMYPIRSNPQNRWENSSTGPGITCLISSTLWSKTTPSYPTKKSILTKNTQSGSS